MKFMILRQVTVNDSHHHTCIPDGKGQSVLSITQWMSLKGLSVVAAAAVIDAIWRLKTKPCLRFPGGFLPIAISLIKSQEHH